MFRWVLGALVLVIAAYYVLHHVLPRLQGMGAGSGSPTETGASADDSAQVCVRAASDAYDTVVGEIRSLGPPPVDSAAWSSVVLDLAAPLSRADNACSCFDTACGKAVEAVAELRGLISLYDGMTRSDATGNPATYMERAAGLLEEARILAGERR